MKYPLIIYLSLVLISSISWSTSAQGNTPQRGDPPVAARISVSAPDEDGMVTIVGEAGAVFPTAQVAIRNLYTQQTVYVSAGVAGGFRTSEYGPGNTPFWVSVAPSIPGRLRDETTALAGGPGTIIYGASPEPRLQPETITQLVLDGDLRDWTLYPQAELSSGVHALANADSIYVALAEAIPENAELVLTFTFDGITHELALNPALPQAALIRETAPVEREPETLAVTAVTSEAAIEMRIDWTGITSSFESAIFGNYFFRTEDSDEEPQIMPIAQPIILYEERDGIVYPGGRLTGDLTRFSISGPVAQGASTWTAIGRINTLDLIPGETVTVELDVTLNAPDLAESMVGLKFIGEMNLQPVVSGPNNEEIHPIATLHTNNGWSNVLTPTGLAIDNLQGDLELGVVEIPAAQIIRRGDRLLAGFQFEMTIPSDLQPGLYVPTFTGKAQISDSDAFAWGDNGVFGEGSGIARQSLTRLPVVLSVGDVQDARLLWTLFYDDPSDGSRGIMADEDTGQGALSNRVRFNSPTYILPAGEYAIEPYLLNQLSNAYDVTTTPLLRLLFPGGRLKATITLPDGTVDDLPDIPILQNRLSTAAVDERELFGAQSPVNAYRLTTLNPTYTAYPFDQYGEYEINLTGTFDDVSGHRYSGGGTYRVVIAEPFDLTPGVLPGTPFEVGDTLFTGGRITPGLPAEVNVHVTLYPLDGSEAIEAHFGPVEADRYGYFTFDDSDFQFETPGEYVIDYEARYTDAQGRLWAGSLRSAGVVASPESPLIAHGQRGVYGYSGTLSADYRPAWFNSALYPSNDAENVYPNYPYHKGDVVVVDDSVQVGVHPALHVQDLTGVYSDWLSGTVPNYVSSFGLSLDRLVAIDELPVLPVLAAGTQGKYGPSLLPDYTVNDAYAYISAVRPDVTVRQFVLGNDDNALSYHWDSDDPYNQQIGVGVDGDRPGDYTFLFGGIVIRNPEAGLRDILPYAALAVTSDEPGGVYPPYRGAAGGDIGKPLMTVRGEPIDIFFHPTGTHPGQVMTVGDELVIAGHVAPTLQSEVQVRVVSPGGDIHGFSGLSNTLGYYYNPVNNLTLTEPGVWSVQITTRPVGVSSAGTVTGQIPTGGVLGAENRTFSIFILPESETDTALSWSRGGDVDSEYRPGIPFNFGVNVPGGWMDIEAYQVISTPSYILEAGLARILGSTVSYQFGPVTLARDFPNLEAEARGEGASASDVVTMTFAITGTDTNGNFAIRTRTLTILHDRLVSFDDLMESQEQEN